MKNVRVNFEGWIQLLGMVGVLGGLVFVGLEMRQSQLIAVDRSCGTTAGASKHVR